MDSNHENERPAERARDNADYEPPTLTAIGNIREVVMGVPGAAWDNHGYSDPIFEFQPDGEES